MKRLLMLALLLLAGAAPADTGPAAYGWQQHPGAQLPLGLSVRDEAGHELTLGRAFGKTPVILDLGYYHCPSLCGVVRSDLINALDTSGLKAGRDYALVVLSIDPAETAADAAQAKASDLTQASLTDGADWHYLTGSAEAIAKVAGTIGFRDRYDATFRQFLHPAGLAVLTKDGVVSGYLLGVGYSGGDLRAAVLKAGTGAIAQASLPVLLLCFHYDPATGRYTLAIEKVLRVMAGLTVVTLAGLLVALHRTRRGQQP
jgi:protein SCO1